MERDPRVEPQRGDVICRMDGPTRVRATVLSTSQTKVFYEIIDPLRKDPIYRIPLSCNMNRTAWVNWAKDADIMHASD